MMWLLTTLTTQTATDKSSVSFVAPPPPPAALALDPSEQCKQAETLNMHNAYDILGILNIHVFRIGCVLK